MLLMAIFHFMITSNHVSTPIIDFTLSLYVINRAVPDLTTGHYYYALTTGYYYNIALEF